MRLKAKFGPYIDFSPASVCAELCNFYVILRHNAPFSLFIYFAESSTGYLLFRNVSLFLSLIILLKVAQDIYCLVICPYFFHFLFW